MTFTPFERYMKNILKKIKKIKDEKFLENMLKNIREKNEKELEEKIKSLKIQLEKIMR